jgi:1-acyl-sn-glycerol-3-phosphate acyltransferase
MWYWVVRTIATFILKTFFRLKIEGRENLPQKTNYIIAANHSSFLDCLLIAAAVPKKIHFLTSRDLYAISWLRWLLPKLEVLSTGASSEKAVEFLLRNKIVGIFPEGHVSRDGNLREFKRGVALLAFKTGRPIVPCALLGAFQALPPKAFFPRLVHLKVKISRPIYLLREFGDIVDDIYLQEGALRLRNIIKEMTYAR